MTRIGIITVQDRNYHPNRRLTEAGVARGHGVFLINPYHVVPEISSGRVSIRGMEGMGLPEVIVPRQGAMVGVASLTVIRHFRTMGIPMVNDLASIRRASNKFLTLQTLALAGIAVPDTLFVNRIENLVPAVDRLGGYPVVAKQINGHQGDGVFLFRSQAEAMAWISGDGFNPSRGILIQQFIQGKGRRDLRIFVVGDQVIGAMELYRTGSDFRSNFHLNGSAGPVDCPDSLKSMAVQATRALGLVVAGVDLILDPEGMARILEVNYSPGFQGLEQVTGKDIAGSIIDLSVAMAGQKSVPD